MELADQDKHSLQTKLDKNAQLTRSHQKRVKEHLKLRARRRFRTAEEINTFMSEVSATDGLEYSYAEKCTILREQVKNIDFPKFLLID